MQTPSITQANAQHKAKQILDLAFAKPLVYLYLSLPFFYEGYLLFSESLAEPADTLNKHFGEWGMQMIVLNLWIGVAVALWKPLPLLLRKLTAHRRALGVASGIYLIGHVTFFYIRESSWDEVFEQIQQGVYLWFGIWAAIFVLLLTLTSNSWSVKFLTHRRWKNLHRTVYLAAVLIMFHMFWIEKSNPIETALYFVPVLLVEAVRLFRFMKNKARAQT